MKKNKMKELVRVQNVIEGDRLSADKGFEEIVLNDLTFLLKDYFDLLEPIDLKIEKGNKNYKISIEFNALRMLGLSLLQK